jgi:hypothetical protein
LRRRLQRRNGRLLAFSGVRTDGGKPEDENEREL